NENDANEVRAMRQRFPDPLSLLANTYNLPPSYNSQKSQYNPQPSELSQYQPIIPPPQQQSYKPPVVQQQSPAPSTQLDSGFVEEQQDFMADGLEEFDSDCDDLQLNTTSIFKADHVDAFDSDCDEAQLVQSSWQGFLLQLQSMEIQSNL
ncbi:hypothetical protein Tco_1084621, partial [Tanacetum coccineum]